ncbi:hypothetical protein DSM100238_1302 [Bifidobacterium apri]|uniref:Transmembrane protein n=1 Tax=Bifidobacterium apri TaxID=1769423 RepID=A0A6A2WD62_9BIFI|nr:hypothetical protein DSM100238_1302 [Bifidobacterium apri]
MDGYLAVPVRQLSQEVWIAMVSCGGCVIGCAGAGLLLRRCSGDPEMCSYLAVAVRSGFRESVDACLSGGCCWAVVVWSVDFVAVV